MDAVHHRRPAAMSWDEASAGDWTAGFKMLDGETLAGLLENYAQVAHRTGELVAQLPGLDAAHPLLRRPGLRPPPSRRRAGCCCM
jgi:hypothetical protein